MPSKTPLFPSREVRNTLNPLLLAAFKQKCPCPRALSAEQAAVILRDVDLTEIRETTLEDVIASVDLAVEREKKWAPWHLSEILQKRRVEAHKAGQKDKRKPKCNPVARGIAENLRSQEQKDQHAAAKMKKAASMAERLEMVRWAQRQTGRSSIGVYAAYLTRAKYNRERKA